MEQERMSFRAALREFWERISGKKALRVGGYSVIASLIVLGIAVALNVLVNALPASWTQYDTSSAQLFTISEQTEGVLADLEEDVTIYWVVQAGQEDETLSFDEYNSTDCITTLNGETGILAPLDTVNSVIEGLLEAFTAEDGESSEETAE